MGVFANFNRITAAACVIATAAVLSGCSSPPALVGNWKADDGTTKVIADSGACKGMFYSGGKPLDIGGGMTCSLSDKEGADGKYSLVVSQPPNQASFLVEFDGDDSATVYDGTGKRVFAMTRL